MNEIRTITRGIFYCRDSAEINDCGSLQLQHGLTVKCSEIGNKNIPPSVTSKPKKKDNDTMTMKFLLHKNKEEK